MLNRPLPAPARDIALLLGRIVLGVVLFAHGWQKLMINGIAGTHGQFEKLGIPLAIVSASFTAFVEFVGGVLLIVGALTTTVVALDLVVMVGAAGFVHISHGIFAQNGGWELVGVIVAAELALAATGPGRFSVDHLMASRRAREEAPLESASQRVAAEPAPAAFDARPVGGPQPACTPTVAQQVAIAKAAAGWSDTPVTEQLQQVRPVQQPVTVADLFAVTGPLPVVPAAQPASPTPAAEPETSRPVDVAPLFEPRRRLDDERPAFGPRLPFEAPRPVAAVIERPGELPKRVRRTEKVG
jgi:putative oxidoreductase